MHKRRCILSSRLHRAIGAIVCIPLIVPASAHAAIDSAPLNYFLHAAGPASAPTLHLNWLFTGICVMVCVIVGALLLIGIVRRRPPADAGALVTSSGMKWITIGTGISTVVIAGMLVDALATLERVATPTTKPALTVTVIAYDWWWKVAYDDSPDPAQRFVTANEIHIPVGEPVRILLQSADVIHAFWVPRLAGKTQAIPGQTNEQWIEADAPGVYRGQCTQFCGAQHAHMAFEVIAEPRAAFDAWRARQAQAITVSNTSPSVSVGRKLFDDRCAGCHAIRGTSANGVQAPDLTHLNTRRLLASGTLVNNASNQLEWVLHAQRIKPDSLMPSFPLDANEARSLAAYLATLN